MINRTKRSPGRPRRQNKTATQSVPNEEEKLYTTAEAIAIIQSGEAKSFVSDKGFVMRPSGPFGTCIGIYDKSNLFHGSKFMFPMTPKRCGRSMKNKSLRISSHV